MTFRLAYLIPLMKAFVFTFILLYSQLYVCVFTSYHTTNNSPESMSLKYTACRTIFIYMDQSESVNKYFPEK